VLLASAFAAVAWAQPPAARADRSLRSRGVFLSYDGAHGSVAVRERGQVREYFLLAGGDSGETEVVIESAAARAGDLAPGSPVIVSWRPDPDDASRRLVHAIEVPAIPRSHPADRR